MWLASATAAPLAASAASTRAGPRNANVGILKAVQRARVEVLEDCYAVRLDLPAIQSTIGTTMAGHKVIIGTGDSSVVFGSKAAALASFKSMLARYRNGEDVNEQDSQLLRNLLERHPEAHQKIGHGVKRFFRDRTDQGTDCFWLQRENGSSTDFSYISCVNAKGKSLYQEFAEACRQAVQPDLDAAKKAHFEKHGDTEGKVRCEVSGEMVASYESHLDHKKPMTFQVIVTTFVAANKIEIRTDMLSREVK